MLKHLKTEMDQLFKVSLSTPPFTTGYTRNAELRPDPLFARLFNSVYRMQFYCLAYMQPYISALGSQIRAQKRSFQPHVYTNFIPSSYFPHNLINIPR